MKLSEIQRLSADYTDNDIEELVTVMQSTLLSSPSSQVRYANVKEADAHAWLKSNVTSSLQAEFKSPRMSTLAVDKDIPKSEYAEHLVIRDLDLKRDIKCAGHIVAHADWRYSPGFSPDTSSKTNKDTGANTSIDANALSEMPKTFPEGLNVELHKQIDDGIVSSIKQHFPNLPMFYLMGISTLTPSHLRKGIAKTLVLWGDVYIDHYAIPSVLYASPAGLHLYRKCGYQEYRDLDIAIDLNKWGTDHTHRHVVMIRWPADETRLPDAWKQWKKTHKAGRPDVDL